MTKVGPISLSLVGPEWSGEVPSPPHDGLTTSQRRQHLLDHPASYLAVTRTPEDLEPGQPSEAEDLLEAGRRALEELQAKKVFGEQPENSYFLYRLSTDGHSQTGVVCGIATSDYDSGLVRIHEQIKGDRADHLASHFEVVRAQSSPIALTFDPPEAFSELVSASTQNEPLLDFVSPDGLHQQVWLVDGSLNEQFTASLGSSTFYLIDGHHRAAAASRLRDRVGQEGDLSRDADWMLCAVFPSDQITNCAFHRIIAGYGFEEIAKLLSSNFQLRPASAETFDERRDSEIVVGAPGPNGQMSWLFVDLPFSASTQDPLANLDPVRLSNLVLEPILNIDESAAPGSALRYESGLNGADRVAAIQLAETEVIFVMRPVPIEALEAAADRGLTMPPKSTYFVPKVRSGVFLRTLGEVT